MRAVDKRGNFQKLLHKRFVVDLRESINFIISTYVEDALDYTNSEFDHTFDLVSRRIDRHASLAEIIKDCGFWKEEFEEIEKRFRLLSQALTVALYPADYFISPVMEYLEKNYLIGLPLFEDN